jgi:hypothetical protein
MVSVADTGNGAAGAEPIQRSAPAAASKMGDFSRDIREFMAYFPPTQPITRVQGGSSVRKREYLIQAILKDRKKISSVLLSKYWNLLPLRDLRSGTRLDF